MGLSIHYSGKLKQADLLTNLIEEIIDVSEAHHWKFHIFNSAYPGNKFSKETVFDEIFGINFTPTDCETISIAFLSNGKMVCPARVHFFANSEKKEEQDYIYSNSVKTQYAGIQTHQVIILFFKYLSNKYFDDFELSDESGYWESNDEEKMKKQFQIYNRLIDDFALAFETLPAKEDEDMITYLERLMKNVNSLKKE